MTSVLYFLHLKTLDIILLIVNISVADDALYIYNVFIFVIWRLNCTWKNVNFQQIFVVKTTERRKNQSEEWTSLSYLFTL